MKTWFRDYFYYTKTERNGIVVLLVILIVFLVLPKLFPYFIAQPNTDFTAYQNEIAAFEASLQVADDTKEGNSRGRRNR